MRGHDKGAAASEGATRATSRAGYLVKRAVPGGPEELGASNVTDRGADPDDEVEGPRALIASAFRIAREDPEQAEQSLRAAAAAADDDPTVHWALGRFLHDLRGDVDGADASYLRALELDPEHPDRKSVV